MHRAGAVLRLAAVLGLAAALYAPGLGFYFVADDFRYLELAGRVQGPLDIVNSVPGACTRVGWPAVVLLFWLGRLTGNAGPEPLRLMSLAIHLTNVVLVYGLARRMGAKSAAALVAALILALHPRQHDTVMWLATLTWSVGALFSLLAAWSYAVWRQSGALRWLLALLLFVALGMIGNPSLVVLPVILAAYDGLVRRADLKTAALWVVLLVIVGGLGLYCGLGSLQNTGDRASYGLALSGVSHFAIFLAYLVWPVPLDLKDMIEATPGLGYGAALLATALVSLVGLAILRRGSLLARWGVVWTALGLAAPAFFSAYLSDHYMAVALVGAALACAGVAQSAPARWTRVAMALAVLWSAFSAAQLVVKLDDWRAATAITQAVRDETHARYPNPSDGTRFHYVGLPDTRKRIVVWSYGIDSAVRIWYNNPTLRAQRDVQFGVRRTPAPNDIILDFSGRW